MAAAERYQHYEVLRRDDGTLWELGRGSMGITYKAYDTSLRCPVALKVINGTYLGSDVARQRFLREARAAAALRHQNVASVFHLGTDKDSYFYAMEFIDGETVEAYMKRKGVLEPVEALGITLQVCKALAAAAKQELVHRDLKPANLMLVDEEGEKVVKVIDFGLAKSSKSEGEESGTLTMGGGFVGTPHFASPEQLEEGDIDIRSDIYSLGATLYYMLTGHPPFSGSVAQIMSQHLYRPLPLEPLQQFPPALVNLIAKMMDKDRNKRPQTTAELRQEITQCLADIHAAPELLGKESSGNQTSTIPALVSPVEPTALAPGAILARRYAITREIEEILQGRRFAANDLQRNRLVSVLVLSHEFLSDSKRYTALEKEVDLLRRASLPGLRAVYSLESAPEGSFLVEEYVSGRKLLEILRVRQTLSPAEALLLLNLLAPVADYARANHLQQVDLTLQGIQLTSGTVGASELSQQPLTEWSQLGVKVAAVDFSCSSPDSATWGGTATLTRSGPHEGPRASYLGLLSMLLYEVLGGPRSLFEGHGRYTPISILSEEGNAVLRRAMIDDLSSAAELVNQLGPHLQARGPKPVQPDRLIAEVRPSTSPILQPQTTGPSTPVDEPPVLPSTVVPELEPPKRPKKTGLIVGGILILLVCGLIGGYALYSNVIKRRETVQATPEPSPVLTPTPTPLQVAALSPTPSPLTPSPTPVQLATPAPTPVQPATPSPSPLQLITPASTPVQIATP
ncbi:MAG: protein kinase, partial [Verrucomicrobia bacterium]|nr:protein kinase [Verrucomicrobiota bacterium]